MPHFERADLAACHEDLGLGQAEAQHLRDFGDGELFRFDDLSLHLALLSIGLLPLSGLSGVAFLLAACGVLASFGRGADGKLGVTGGEPADSGVGEFADDQRGLRFVEVLGSAVLAAMQELLAAPVGAADGLESLASGSIATRSGREATAEAEHVGPTAEPAIGMNPFGPLSGDGRIEIGVRASAIGVGVAADVGIGSIADEAAGPGARAQTPPIAVHRDQRDLPVWTSHVGMISTSAGARRSTRSTVVHKGPSGERLVA